MPKYLARWTRVRATELEFEADDDELAYDHATHVEVNSEYLETDAEWSDGEIELRDVEEIPSDKAALQTAIWAVMKKHGWRIKASDGMSDLPPNYVAETLIAELADEGLTIK